MKKFFHISEVLTVITGRMLCQNGTVGVRSVVWHVMGGTEPTDTGCMVLEAPARTRVLEQHPELKDPPIVNPEFGQEAFDDWLKSLWNTNHFVELEGTPVIGDGVWSQNFDLGTVKRLTPLGTVVVDVNGADHYCASDALIFAAHVDLEQKVVA